MALRRGFQDHFDWPLFVTTAAISVVGVINLYSASSAAGGALRDVYIQQIYWLTLGAGAAVLVAAVDYRHFERLATFLYLGGMLSLGLVFILGSDIRGSSRWIEMGRFAFQPILKVLRQRRELIESGVKLGEDMQRERAELLPSAL